MHGLAWLPGTPDVEQFLHADNDSLKEIIIQQADQLLSTVNPAVHTDGSNVADALPPKIDPHIWNKVYGDVNDLASNWARMTAILVGTILSQTVTSLRPHVNKGRQLCSMAWAHCTIVCSMYVVHVVC